MIDMGLSTLIEAKDKDVTGKSLINRKQKDVLQIKNVG